MSEESKSTSVGFPWRTLGSATVTGVSFGLKLTRLFRLERRRLGLGLGLGFGLGPGCELGLSTAAELLV